MMHFFKSKSILFLCIKNWKEQSVQNHNSTRLTCVQTHAVSQAKRNPCSISAADGVVSSVARPRWLEHQRGHGPSDSAHQNRISPQPPTPVLPASSSKMSLFGLLRGPTETGNFWSRPTTFPPIPSSNERATPSMSAAGPLVLPSVRSALTKILSMTSWEPPNKSRPPPLWGASRLDLAKIPTPSRGPWVYCDPSCRALQSTPSSRDPPLAPRPRKLLGGGHKSRVDRRTGSYAQSRGEANQDSARWGFGTPVGWTWWGNWWGTSWMPHLLLDHPVTSPSLFLGLAMCTNNPSRDCRSTRDAGCCLVLPCWPDPALLVVFRIAIFRSCSCHESKPRRRLQPHNSSEWGALGNPSNDTAVAWCSLLMGMQPDQLAQSPNAIVLPSPLVLKSNWRTRLRHSQKLASCPRAYSATASGLRHLTK